MSLGEIISAVEQLSPEEWRQLREYMERREAKITHSKELHAGTVDMDTLMQALAEISAGLSDEEFAEIECAMNEEYIEPMNEDE